eukprot:357663-Chlamydomonas_euryale.AAC.7
MAGAWGLSQAPPHWAARAWLAASRAFCQAAVLVLCILDCQPHGVPPSSRSQQLASFPPAGIQAG